MNKTFLPGLALGLLALSAPAQADHGISGHGGGVGNVMGPDTLAPGDLALALTFSLGLPHKRSDDELADLASRHIHGHTGDYNLVSTASLAYGLASDLTIITSLPYVRRDDLREGVHDHHSATVNGVEELGTVAGIGDARLIAHWRFAKWHDGGVALMGGIKLPTGKTRQRSDDGERLEVEHQPGSGSVDFITGIAAGTDEGPWKFAASASREWTRKGALDTRLGNRTLVGASAGYVLGEMGHHHDEEGEAPHHHDSTSLFVETTYEVEGKQRVAGEIEEESGAKVVRLSPGIAHEWASGWSAGVSAGVPLWQRVGVSHPNNKVRMTLSLGRSF